MKWEDTCRESGRATESQRARSRALICDGWQDSAKKDAMQAAKERQKALLASFAAQQQLFADTMLSESEEEEESDEQSDDKVECVICSQSGPPSEENPVGLVCLVQRSTLLADHSQKARAVFSKKMGLMEESESGPGCILVPTNLDSGANLHVQSCGHHIHASCFHSYMETLSHRTTMREQPRLDASSGLFLCPLCRQMGNALLPILPKGLRREGSDGKRQASALMHAAFAQALTDGYLQVERPVESGRTPPIPLGVSQMEGSQAAQLTFGRALSTAVSDFLKRLVAISGNASDRTETSPILAAEFDKLGLEMLVRGIGMTLGCMEVCNRDPCAESLDMRRTLQGSQERVLAHVRLLHQLAISVHCDIENGGDSSHAGIGAQVGSETTPRELTIRQACLWRLGHVVHRVQR